MGIASKNSVIPLLFKKLYFEFFHAFADFLEDRRQDFLTGPRTLGAGAKENTTVFHFRTNVEFVNEEDGNVTAFRNPGGGKESWRSCFYLLDPTIFETWQCAKLRFEH